MSKTDDFCMTLLAHRSRTQAEFGPQPFWWRISPGQHRSIVQHLIERGSLPAEEPAVRMNDHGRFWGVPFIVSDKVPDGCVMFTTDYKEWHILKVDL